MTFELDTSGSVFVPISPDHVRGYRWSDLTPFYQGYVGPMFAELALVAHRTRPPTKLNDSQIWLLKCGRTGFSPVTLTRPYEGHGSQATRHTLSGLVRRGWISDPRNNGIMWITDAGEKALKTATPLGFSDLAPETLARIIADCERWCADLPPHHEDTAEDGREFYARRQDGLCPAFPPLTPFLSDEGLIFLKEVG